MHTPIRGHASMTHIIISHPSFYCIYSARLLKKASTLAPLLPAIHSGQDASSMEGIPSEVDLDSSMTGFSPPMAQEPRAIKDPYPKMARNIFYNIENNQNEQNVTHSSQAVVIPIHTAQHSTAQHRKHHTHTYSTLRNTLNTTPMQFIELLPSFTHSFTHSLTHLILDIVAAHKAGHEGLLAGLVWVLLGEGSHGLSLGHSGRDSS
jgi:hypothetical protein